MIETKRRAYADGLNKSSYLDADWQTVIENGCKLLDEKEAINFGIECVSRVLDYWALQFPNDDRVHSALRAVESWSKGEQNVAEDRV